MSARLTGETHRLALSISSRQPAGDDVVSQTSARHEQHVISPTDGRKTSRKRLIKNRQKEENRGGVGLFPDCRQQTSSSEEPAGIITTPLPPPPSSPSCLAGAARLTQISRTTTKEMSLRLVTTLPDPSTFPYIQSGPRASV